MRLFRDYEAWKMRYRDGLSYQKIGNILGVSRERAGQLVDRFDARMGNPGYDYFYKGFKVSPKRKEGG